MIMIMIMRIFSIRVGGVPSPGRKSPPGERSKISPGVQFVTAYS
nr:MAG TPA: hypothetical protein [Caudoviricetes sp.]